jgi:hypothetical protein
MKTNIRTAKTKLYEHSIVYYVPSKSGGDEHIVVMNGATLFCDCKDFMTRRLPLYGTGGFSHCTHGRQVLAHIADIKHKFTFRVGTAVPRKEKPCGTTALAQPVKKRYGIFTTHGGYRSIDLPKEYSTKAAAEKDLRNFSDTGFRCVRAL